MRWILLLHFYEKRHWKIVWCWLVLNSSSLNGRWLGDSQMKYSRSKWMADCVLFSSGLDGLFWFSLGHPSVIQEWRWEEYATSPAWKIRGDEKKVVVLKFPLLHVVFLLCCSEQSTLFIHALQKKSIFDLSTGWLSSGAGRDLSLVQWMFNYVYRVELINRTFSDALC